MRRCATVDCPLRGDASGRGKGDRKGCRAASATIGARTRRAGMHWPAPGAARAAARRDAHRGLTWRRVDIGDHLARRCHLRSTMAAQLTYVRATHPNQRGSRIVIPPMHTTRTRISTRTPIIYSMRNTRRMRRTLPHAQCTARSDNQRRSIAPLILRYSNLNRMSTVEVP